MKLFLLSSLLSTCFVLSLAYNCDSNDVDSYCYKDTIDEEFDSEESDHDEVIELFINPQENDFSDEVIEADILDQDYNAPIDRIIESRGFSFEKHHIVTKDGYILGAFRLVNPFVSQSARSKLKPIVLQHGFLGVGQDWLINAPGGDAVSCDDPSLKQDLPQNNNLGFFLANNCYDVWISNTRGNIYSRNHTKLDPDSKDKKFWEFTIDEMIAYDAPAIIDYVLKKTGFSSLTWIGHSQGTMIMFGLLSQKPEYSNKVKPFIALAPVFYVANLAKVLKIAAHGHAVSVLKAIGGELSHNNAIMKSIEKFTCPKFAESACVRIIQSLSGYNEQEINQTRVEVYKHQYGSGTSVWNLVHFAQNVYTGNVHKFDYGRRKNLARYGQPKPPAYRLESINSTSMALFYSQSDDLADLKDVHKLIGSLRVPLIKDYFIPETSWNHLDFLYAKETYKYINTEIIKLLSSF